MPLLPVNKAKGPPTDSTVTFGPGAVATLTKGVTPTKATPKKKSGVTRHTAEPSFQPGLTPQGTTKTPFDVEQPVPPIAPVQNQPVALAPPSGPPVPSLQRYGVNMGIYDVNNEVQQITDSFKSAKGYSPPPDLIFDVLKSKGMTGQLDYNKLFDTPTSAAQALHDSVARSFGGDEIATLPVIHPTADVLAKSVVEAVNADKKAFNETGHPTNPATSNLTRWYQVNGDQLYEAMNDPVASVQMTHTLMAAGIVHPESILQVAAMGPAGLDITMKVASVGVLTVSQIVGGTPNYPYGFYKLARGAGLDLWDLQSGQYDKAFHTINNAKLFGKGVWDDVNNPTTRPGYLLQDLWMGWTLGAGTVARVGVAGAAVRAARAGEEGVARGALSTAAHAAGPVVKALVSRPPPEFTPMGLGTYWESLPLNDTAGVKLLQKHVPVIGREARQARLVSQLTDGYDVGDRSHILDMMFGSTAKMLSRARMKRIDIDYGISMSAATEMQRLQQGGNIAKGVLQDIRNGDGFADKLAQAKAFRSLTVKQRFGVDKLVMMIMGQLDDPFTEWRNFHTGEIANVNDVYANTRAVEKEGFDEEGNPVSREAKGAFRQYSHTVDAHRAQLEAIDLAEQILRDPPKRLQPLIDHAFASSGRTERMKNVFLGLDEFVGEQRIAREAALVRGEKVIQGPDGLWYTTENPDADTIVAKAKSTESSRADAVRRVEKAKATDRLHPGLNAQELESAKNALVRHEAAAKKAVAEVEKLHENATLLRDDSKWLPEGANMVNVYHGTKTAVDKLSTEASSDANRFGHTIFLSESKETAASYARPVASDLAESQQLNVRLHQIDKSTLFPVRDNQIIGPDEISKVLDHLTPEEQKVAETLETVNLADVNTTIGLYQYISALGSALEHDGVIPTTHTYGRDFANDVLARAGYTGIEDSPGTSIAEIAMFDPDAIHGQFDPVLEQKVRELRQGKSPSYVKMASEKYREFGGVSRPKVGPRVSRYGLKLPKWRFNMFTGKALEMGDFRYDVGNLLSEDEGAAYHAMQNQIDSESLWGIGIKSAHRPGPNFEPMRNVANVPTQLRHVMNAMAQEELDANFAKVASDENLRKIRQWQYPSLDELEPNEDYRWVDKDLIMNKVGGLDTNFWQNVDKLASRVMTPINEPMRLMLVFGVPAYALNLLGSAALLLMDEGPFAPMDLGRAMYSHHFYGPEVTRLLDVMAGDTFTRSMVTEKNLFTKGSQNLMRGWQQVTDTYFRRASVMHHLRRQGLLKGESPEEVYAQLTSDDPVIRQKVIQASQSARHAMLDFNDMTWPEKATLRHLFFVYSFVRASTIWSLRYLRDHGGQADIFMHEGEDRERNIDQMVGVTPQWVKQQGYFAVAPHTFYNPIQWNMPGMLAQNSYPVASMLTHVPYSSVTNLSSPALSFYEGLYTGKDQQGRDLPQPQGWETHIPGSSGTLVRSFLNIYNQTPFGVLSHKAAKTAQAKANPLPPLAVRAGHTDPISAALSQERAATQFPSFATDGFWNTTGQALFRSAVPITVNDAAMAGRYWRELRTNDPAAFHQHELDAVQNLLVRQEKVLGEEAPSGVHDALNTIATVSIAIEDWKRDHPTRRTPNAKTINQITLDSLVAQGKIKNPAMWKKRIADDIGESMVKHTQTSLLWAAGGRDWYTWTDRVSKIDNYAQPAYRAAVVTMKDTGLGDYTKSAQADIPTKWSYGRKSQAILSDGRQLAAQVAAHSGYQQSQAMQEWIQYVNQHDHPIKVDGHTFPSPYAFEFATKTPDEKAKALASWTKKKPSEQTALQQQLLTGERPDPIVAEGWAAIYASLKKAQDALPFGKHLWSGARRDDENQVAAQVPEFKKELAFERSPLGVRLASYKPIQNSPNADSWTWLLDGANAYYKEGVKQYTNPDTGHVNQSLVTANWTYALPAIMETIKADAAFSDELRLYTGATDEKTADAYLHKFLVKLVAP